MAASARGDITFFAPTAGNLIALTLDDGPDPTLTPDVLDVLRAHDVRATFFLIGSRAAQAPRLVEEIRRAGHEIGNHLWREERTLSVSDAAFEQALLRTDAVLRTHDAPRLFRPGSGLISRDKTAIAKRHGYRCVLGSVYPFDAQFLSPRWTPRIVRRLLQPGDIVILHEGRPTRRPVLGVLDHVLSDARRRGFRAVTAGELLARG
jgi:peptidoglycan/xylan/chitin deacetylase (PgdA/CDA1 family)